LITKACHPRRILWYDEDISTDKSHPLYGITQKDIDSNYLGKMIPNPTITWDDVTNMTQNSNILNMPPNPTITWNDI